MNVYLPKELCSMTYKDLDQAIKLIQSVGKSCFVAKSDFKAAF